MIGHEISHGFDNLGAGFDRRGPPAQLVDARGSRALQGGRRRRLSRSTHAYEPLPGLHLNGQQTLGENIADLAGLAAAYDAYHASLNGQAAPVINGLTGDQRFFLAYAQSWRDEDPRSRRCARSIATDVHAPARWRAQTVRNLDAWYSAFSVSPARRCS